MNAQDLHKFYFDELKWCGCGNPEEALEYVGKILDVLNRRSLSNGTEPHDTPYEKSAWKKHTDELQALIGGWDDMKGLIVLYVLDAHGLTEHGGNVNGSWLTEKGLKVLSAIQKYGDEWREAGYPDDESFAASHSSRNEP